MEVLLFFAAMAVFLIAVFMREAFEAKKKEKRFIESLYNDYGVLPGKEYSL